MEKWSTGRLHGSSQRLLVSGSSGGEGAISSGRRRRRAGLLLPVAAAFVALVLSVKGYNNTIIVRIHTHPVCKVLHSFCLLLLLLLCLVVLLVTRLMT
jgi:hypothetical protein